jgi:hypothetical protein
MKRILVAAMACALAPGLGAAVLRDWTTVQLGKDLGLEMDAAGSAIQVSQAQGPAQGSKALHMEASLVLWGGAWTAVRGGIPQAGGLRFQAQSGEPLQLKILLRDAAGRSAMAKVRLRGGAWERFELPSSSFKVLPNDDGFDLAKLARLSMQPTDVSACALDISTLESVERGAVLKDGGSMAPGVVQDFIALEPSAYGPVADASKGTISLEVKPGAPDGGGRAAWISYAFDGGGFCGEWMRSGTDWGGQDWSKGKSLVFEVHSTEPLKLQAAFVDGAQNAYVGPIQTAEPGAWRSLAIPFRRFILNPYYQPPMAKKGEPMDLRHIDNVSLLPLTPGKHGFWLRLVRVEP